MKRMACISILIAMTILSSGLLNFNVAAKPVIGSTIITLYPIADSYVESANPDSNYGNSTTLLTKLDSRYTYIMFDLSSVPENAYIISATLKVYLSDIGGCTGSIAAHYSSDDSWTELGITWNNKPDFAETATDTVYYGMFVFYGYDSWNVTTDLRTALGQGKLTEVLVDRRSSSYASFDSKEGSHSPKLEVEYALEPIYEVHLESVQDTGASSSVGQTKFAHDTFSLPMNIPVVTGNYEVTYNSGYVFLGWETSGGVSVSDAYAKTTTVTVSGTGTLRAVGSGETIEYGYDDGTAEYSADKKSGQMLAVRFTPVLSDKLTSARIFFRSVSSNASKNIVKVHVLDANHKDLIEPLTQTPMSEGWFDVDLSAYTLMVTAGNDFYIAVEWTANYYPKIGKDSGQPNERSWSWDEATWSFEEHYNYMIRAVVGKLPTTITCSLFPKTVTIGSNVTVSGSISPARSVVKVTLTYISHDGSIFTRTVTTTATGKYSDVYAPDSLGLWSVYASWAGDEIYAGATSPKAVFTVTKASSTISCSLSTSIISIGKSVAISGSISPPCPVVTVYMQYSTDGGKTWNAITSVTTGSAGSYLYTWTPPSLGSYILQSCWNGDNEHTGAYSAEEPLTVEKTPSTISCSASPTSVISESSTKISGSISPAVADITVTIYFRVGGGAWSTLSTVTTTSAGGYTCTWTPASIGTYEVKANWAGDETHHGSESDIITVAVTKKPSEISCTLSKTTIKEGESITVSGSISPPKGGATVITEFTKPDGSTFTGTVATGSDGFFSGSYEPAETGSWSVKASWEGDSVHEGASSLSESFTVEEKKGCIIATATYGSELSPEVQFLREFRDNTVLNTFAGRNFMIVFNAGYYSFSPTVASVIADNSILRGFMKIILYPLIGILHLASITYSLLSFNPELAVVASGLVASSLIGVAYFASVAFIPCLIKKAKIPAKALRILSLTLVVSAVCITIAEIIQSPGVMIFSTAMFVLTSMSLSPVNLMKLLLERVAYPWTRAT